MSVSPGVGVDTSIGLGVGYKESVDLSADLALGMATLVIGDHVAEIRLARCHLETLRDQVPGVLTELGALDAAEERAAEAGNRVLKLAATLTSQATTAEQAGDHDRAHALRDTAEQLSSAYTALEEALAAVDTAAQAADELADDAQRLLEDRSGAERRAAPGQPGEAHRVNGHHPPDAA